jgi:hypothetical protein
MHSCFQSICQLLFKVQAVHTVPDEVDFVYVDARHDYCGVCGCQWFFSMNCSSLGCM